MITATNLTKLYGNRVVVDALTFTAEAGTVTGFLGPNGAGKSSTLRMLVGLSEPTAGGATIGGRSYRELRNPGRQVGVLLDATALHPGRTGRELLTLGARTIGIPSTRVEEVLDLVGLDERAGRARVRTYSLGMRQRLGVAHALLADPEVLILDEPANGLDPHGIHWMRALLRGHADRGGTVLLSSHLLREVELIADHLLVIHQGRLVSDGSLADLRERSASLEDAFLQLTA